MFLRSARRQSRTRGVSRPDPIAIAAMVIVAGLSTASCGRQVPDAVALSWTLSPSSPAVGPAALTVGLRDRAGAAIAGAAVRVEAHMSHPGMSPVIANAVERTPGVYVASFTFTMPGDWVLLVSAAPSSGGRVERRIDVANVRPPD